VGGPVLLLTVVDRAVVLNEAHWKWVAREVPTQLLDPYRIEAILRTTPPGPRNVLLLGDSTMEAAADLPALNRELGPRGLRAQTVTIGGTPTLAFGFLARAVADLRPSMVVLMVSPYSVRSENFLEATYTYDVRAVPDLFPPRALIDDFSFHLAGAAGQANVLFRHRRAMQRAAGVRWGSESWRKLRMETIRAGIKESRAGGPLLRWMQRPPDTYPNPNTRAIDLLARRLHAAGAKLVVIEGPIHPLTGLMIRESRYAAFRARMKEQARAGGFTFRDAGSLPPFTLEDFRDQTHLNDQGRRTFTRALTDILRAAR
jgi:hypothetical protein